MSAPDWNWIAANLCIVVGSAVVLSTFGFSYTKAAGDGHWSQILFRLPYLKALTAGVCLVWIGVLIEDTSLFQKIFWGCVAGLAIWNTFHLYLSTIYPDKKSQK